MLGIVFTEFLEMVEDTFSFDAADNILESLGTGHPTSFTAVGDYDHATLVKMVALLSKDTDTPIDDLIKAFGTHLFHRFAHHYPDFFDNISSSLDFLEGIENRIHTQVKKLYPQAELPTFDCVRQDDTTLVMTYSSVRPFGDLADGLIKGCGEHFGEKLLVKRDDIEGKNNVRFTVQVV